MPRRIRKSNEARRDLREHFLYLARLNVTLARRFLRAFDNAVEQLVEMPEMAGRWEPLHPGPEELRVWTIRRFPNYLIFYRIIADGIEVVRVLHGAQDIERLLGG